MELRKMDDERQQALIKCKSDEAIIQGQIEDLNRAVHDETQTRGILCRQILADFAATKDELEEKLLKVENQIHASGSEVTNRIQDFDTLCHDHYQQFLQLLEEKDISSLELNKRITGCGKDVLEVKDELMKTSIQSSSNSEKSEGLAKQIIQVERKVEAMLQTDNSAREGQYRSMENRIALLS